MHRYVAGAFRRLGSALIPKAMSTPSARGRPCVKYRARGRLEDRRGRTTVHPGSLRHGAHDHEGHVPRRPVSRKTRPSATHALE